MKRIISIVSVIVLICILFAGCNNDTAGNSQSDGDSAKRLNYNYDMTQYVKLDSYKVEVDPQSDLYKNYLNGKLRTMMKATKTQGVVADGDIVNIDYVGKKDGVAFEGGTANGYELTIGSGAFIDGFESGLVGVKIGSTVDLNLTFPKDYGSEELAGQKVVFTVKVNYVTVAYSKVNTENAKACGYESAREVMDIAEEYAFKQTALDMVYENAKVETYPDKEFEIFYNDQISVYKLAAKENSISYEEYAAYYNMTVSELESYAKDEYAVPLTKDYALCYYIIDAAGERITDELVEKQKKELAEQTGREFKDLGISKKYVEAEAVRVLAEKIIIENAVLKETSEE